MRRRNCTLLIVFGISCVLPIQALAQYPQPYGWWCDDPHLAHVVGTATVDGFGNYIVATKRGEIFRLSAQQTMLVGDVRQSYTLRLKPNISYEIWGKKLSKDGLAIDYFRPGDGTTACHSRQENEPVRSSE